MINLLKALFSPMLEEIKQSICESVVFRYFAVSIVIAIQIGRRKALVRCVASRNQHSENDRHVVLKGCSVNTDIELTKQNH